MNIDTLIKNLDSYFENTPKEHFEEVWDKVKKYEECGPSVDEFLHKEGIDEKETAHASESYVRLTSCSTKPVAV